MKQSMIKRMIGLGMAFIMLFSILGFVGCDIVITTTPTTPVESPTLEEYREIAIQELRDYANGRGARNFSTANWLIIEGHLAGGVEAINIAEDKAGVRTAKDTAKQAIGAVDTLPQVPFRVRAAHIESPAFYHSVIDSSPSFFDYTIYEKTRPLKGYEPMDRNSDAYIWRQNQYDFVMISSAKELQTTLSLRSNWLGFPLAEPCFENRRDHRYLLQLYDEEFFENNVLILYYWHIQSLNTFSFIDAVKIYDTTLRVNISQFVNYYGSAIASVPTGRFAIEISRTKSTGMATAETAELLTRRYKALSPYRYWPLPAESARVSFLGPFYRDPHLIIRW